jgi:beta-phosphoglucomutase
MIPRNGPSFEAHPGSHFTNHREISVKTDQKGESGNYLFLRSAKIEAILFDLDGVIIDSEPLYDRTIQFTSIHLGRELSDEERGQFKGLTEGAVARLLLQFNPGASLTAEEVSRFRLAIVADLYDEIQLVKGALDFIKYLKQVGLLLGLTTSALRENQQRAFERFDLECYFDVIISGNDVKKGKPDPEPYLLTAARLDVDPSGALVIEDSVNGIRSGQAAGCKVVGLTTSFEREILHQAGADLVIDGFSELRLLLRERR